MVFIVTTPLKSFFTIVLSKVSCTLYRPDPNYNANFFYEVNFDNYVHFSSTVTQQSTSWRDKHTFLYETIHPHLLVNKLCRLNVFSKSAAGYRGTAAVDLLTLATGPRQIVLSLMDGDVAVGRIWFTLSMTEVCESICTVSNLNVSSPAGAPPSWFSNAAAWELFVMKRAEDDGFSFGSGTHGQEGTVSFAEPLPQHHFSLDSIQMLNLTGLLFLLRDASSEEVYAEGASSFAEALRAAIQSATEEERGNTAENQGEDTDDVPLHEDSAENLVTEPHIGQDMGRTFQIRDLPLTLSQGGPSSLRLSCTVHLSKVIKFVQMEEGVTVEGVVCGKPTPGFVRPPFVQEMEVGDDNGFEELDDTNPNNATNVTNEDDRMSNTSRQSRPRTPQTVDVTFETEV